MRLRIVLLLGCLSALIAACGVLDRREPVVITATPDAAQRAAAPAPTPALAAITGTFANHTALLDGVCSEFLFASAGETFVWDTPDALAAFYDRVDNSGLCRRPAARGTFDFGGAVLAGAIHAATGCDAAFQVLGLAQDDITRTQTLSLALAVEPGCEYELVEPLVVAVPPPPDGYTLQIAVTGP